MGTSSGRIKLLGVLALLIVTSTACGGRDGDPAVAAQTSPPTSDALPRIEEMADAVALGSFAADIEAFWRQHLPEHYGYTLIAVIDILPYHRSEATPLPSCNGAPAEPGFYIDNAFYCRMENVIRYDAEGLIPDLRTRFSTFTLGVVVAHEYGHAIQRQVGETGSTLSIELQADCFAGAWSADYRSRLVADGRQPPDLEPIFDSLTAYADPVATPADDPDAHGTESQRVAAFKAGVEEGLAGCINDESAPATLSDG